MRTPDELLNGTAPAPPRVTERTNPPSAGVVLSREGGTLHRTRGVRSCTMDSAIERVGNAKPDWLEGLSRDPADGAHVHRVGELLPAGYATYLRLFHPFAPWGVDPYLADASEFRSWRSLAEEAGVEFSGELTWRTLEPVIPIVEGGGRRYAVPEGELDPIVRRRLFSILSAFTAPQPTYFFYGISALVMGQEALLLRASLDAVEKVIAAVREGDINAAVESPELVWPEDRSWLLYTDYDLVSTYIASNRAVASALIADEHVEAVEITRQTRFDDRADDPAPPAATA